MKDGSILYLKIILAIGGIFLIFCAVLKRLATPSDFHVPLPSIVPFVLS